MHRWWRRNDNALHTCIYKHSLEVLQMPFTQENDARAIAQQRAESGIYIFSTYDTPDSAPDPA